MSENSNSLIQALSEPENMSRRRFVLGVSGATLLAGLGFKPDTLSAAGQWIFSDPGRKPRG